MARVAPHQLELGEAPPDPPPLRRSSVRRPRQPSAERLLTTPGALLTRSHLRELGLGRRAIDAVFRRLPIVALPGYSRPMIYAEDYLALIAENTYRDDRVRPIGSGACG